MRKVGSIGCLCEIMETVSPKLVVDDPALFDGELFLSFIWHDLYHLYKGNNIHLLEGLSSVDDYLSGLAVPGIVFLDIEVGEDEVAPKNGLFSH